MTGDSPAAGIAISRGGGACPEVFVRPLGHDELRRLKRRANEAKQFATRERAAILLASHVGNSVPQTAQMWMTDESHVRR